MAEDLWSAAQRDAEEKRRELGGEGILSDRDIEELSAGADRVRVLMSDSQWHDAEEIRRAAEGSEGLRRLRELRKFGAVLKSRVPGSRLFRYKFTPGVPAPTEGNDHVDASTLGGGCSGSGSGVST